jgi:hypothetical protein
MNVNDNSPTCPSHNIIAFAKYDRRSLHPFMDHLPAPLGASDSCIVIPFVADIPWDFKDFDKFPARHSFITTEDGWPLLDAIDVPRLASLLQSWLYFGLLSDILEITVRTEDFCRTRPTHNGKPAAKILDSSELASLLNTWTKGTRYQSIYEFILWRFCKQALKADKKKDAINGRLRRVLQICAYVGRHRIGRAKSIAEILLSIEVLCCTFNVVTGTPVSLYRENLHQNYGQSWETTDLFACEMIRAGWCRASVSHIVREHDICTLQFISRIKPPRVPWISHEDCTERCCTANNVHKDTYENRHVRASCSCKLVYIERENRAKMIDIIRAGGVPLISLENVTQETPRLEVVQHKPGMRYFAISHVWSDGLGNPHANALPLCQLRNLSTLLEESPTSWAFFSLFHDSYMLRRYTTPRLIWMDTLCIPPAERGDVEYELRLDCIDRMAMIYASAWSVLVLDRGLQQIRLAVSSVEEIVAHIIYCAWNGRIWTLQEGALGQRISFRFADGFIDPSLLERNGILIPSTITKQGRFQSSKDRWSQSGKQTPRTSRKVDCKTAISVFLKGRLVSSLNDNLRHIERVAIPSYTKQHGLDMFARVWNALRKRTTTMPEDTYVVLANLLGIHPGQLSSLDEEHRLETIIMNMDKISQSLLYNTGRKLRSRHPHSQRWIPVHISNMRLNPGCHMKRSKEGFIINDDSSGLIVLSPTICQETGPIIIRCTAPQTDSSYSQSDVWVQIDLFRDTSSPQLDPCLYKGSCILIDQSSERSSSCIRWSAVLLHTNHDSPSVDLSNIVPGSARLADTSIPALLDRLRSTLRSLKGWFSSGERKHDSSTTTRKELFNVTYDCAAQVTILREPPKREVLRRFSLSTLDGAPLKLEARAQYDRALTTPWQSNDKRQSAVRLSPAKSTITQDDCATERRTISLLSFVDPTHIVRFPQTWNLVLKTCTYSFQPSIPDHIEQNLYLQFVASNDGDKSVYLRPYYPQYNFLAVPSGTLLVGRLLALIAPLTSLVTIGLLVATQLPKVSHYRSWKTTLAIHCIYTALNILTLHKTSAAIFLLVFGQFYMFVLIFSTVVLFCDLFIKNSVWQSDEDNDKALTSLGVMVLVPLWGCYAYTGLLGVIFGAILKRAGYKYWLSTFDRDWQPEDKMWWLRHRWNLRDKITSKARHKKSEDVNLA